METSLPKRIFQYEIHDLIGCGQNGEVYKGADPTSGSEVVVKLLHPEVTADNGFRHRCRKLLNTARGLDHPNLAVLHDIIEHDNRIVLVSEFVQGESLEQMFAGTPVAVASFLDKAVQMAQGLEHLHHAELVHGNLHPSNILVTPDGQIKLTDFCLPRRLTDSQSELGGFRPGTVAFASPEEVRHEQPLPSSDLFSLGAVYYLMLSGRPPFPGQSVTDLSRQILTRRPDYAAISGRRVPGEIILLLRRMMSAKDDERCAESSELLVTLEAISGFQRDSKEHRGSHARTQSHRFYLLLSLLAILMVLLWSVIAKNHP
ncbi:MAG: serine/threonine protein kinase [candidate division Zixibacteria bacterium]|nr:serine/threonine protein kinase [candidate division Zixibacteria bacterium]MDH3936439.1 serine/threonine protein kinase [candidate division Zixibacteria bacterium]MDH4032622.1 serine/threonine protein kinase [candidate division Zixibacteria bacterium]